MSTFIYNPPIPRSKLRRSPHPNHSHHQQCEISLSHFFLVLFLSAITVCIDWLGSCHSFWIGLARAPFPKFKLNVL